MSCYDSSPALSLRRGCPLPRRYRRCSLQRRRRWGLPGSWGALLLLCRLLRPRPDLRA